MNLSPISPTIAPAATSVQTPPAGDRVIGQVGRVAHDGSTIFQDLHVVSAPTVPATVYPTVEDARQGARELAKSELIAGRTGSWISRHDPAVWSIALLSNGAGGVTLARTDGIIDDYQVRDGYLFRRWTTRSGDDLVRATDPQVLGLVSHGHWADLRDQSGAVTHTQRL